MSQIRAKQNVSMPLQGTSSSAKEELLQKSLLNKQLDQEQRMLDMINKV